jgi:hypothetical protein
VFSPAEIKAAGLHDFRNFVREIWKHLGLPPPTPVQLDIARTLQHGPERLVVQAFRGVGKSWETAAFVLWILLLNPQKKIMVVSASQTLADNFSIFCKSLVMQVPILQHLQPRPDQRYSNLSWDVGPATPDPAPSVKSAGITGQITGSRADIIVADDVEIPKNSYTHLLRDKLAESVKEFDAILKPGGRVIYLGTPQVEQSLYRRLAERGYIVRIWPSEIPENTTQYADRLAPYVRKLVERGDTPGTPIDPLRFDREELDKRRLSYGRSSYALQFLLDTSPSDADAHPLKCRDVIVVDMDKDMGWVKLVWGQAKEQTIEDLPCGGFDQDRWHRPAWVSQEMAGWQGTVMAVDPSGRGTDETAYAIVRFLHGTLYVVEVGGFVDGFAASTLEKLAQRAAYHGVNKVICEENYGGGMFTQLLKPYLVRFGGGSVDEEWNGWSRGQKESRICDVLQPLLESHRMVFDRRIITDDIEVQGQTEAYSFIYQLTRIKRERGALAHDDRVEALSMACAYWTERMNRDAQQALDTHREELLAKDLIRFMDHVLGKERYTGGEMTFHSH